MKSKLTLWLATTVTLVATSFLVAEEVVQIHPRFDSGRIRTNTVLDGQSFNQWTNGTGANWANNVGWNPEGVWYSFIRFSGPRAQDGVTFSKELPDLHALMSAAGSITLRGDVVWLERNPDFPVDPGMDLAVFFVPGLNIAEGQFPIFANTWPWNYANAVLATTIRTSDMMPLRDSFGAAEFDPVSTRDKMEYNLQIDLTDAIQSAIEAGTLQANTPWGIVFFPNDMVDQLNTPNNPQWLDRRGTVVNGSFWELVMSETTVEPEPTWAGFAIDANGWVDTGDFLGYVFPAGDFIYVHSLNGWMYMPESMVGEAGSWGFLFR